MAMSQTVGFRVGAEFSSYSELHREFRRYQRDCAVQLWTRHSRTIEAQRRRAPKRPMNDALRFAEIDYACIHGGKLFRAKGTGKRTNQRTNKTKCPCVIKVRLSPDGDKFVVKEMIESHNHTVQETERERFPRQRRFDSAVQRSRADIKENVGVAAQQGIPRDDTCREKGSPCKTNRTDLEKMVPPLAAVKDATVVVVVSKANVLQAIYFQDNSMKRTFERFPEVLLMDVTYKWDTLRLPTFLLLVIDGNGESELVCMWFVQSEERETIKQLLHIFKQKNPAAERIQTVMCSGKSNQGEVISEVLPHSKPITCLFHTLRTFQTDITTDKLQVTVGQRNLLLEILHNMCYAASAEEYDLLYHQLLDTNAQRAIDYFHRQWHGSRGQWVESFKHEGETYLTSTVKRVELLSQQLQARLGKPADSASLAEGLLRALGGLRAESEGRDGQQQLRSPPAESSPVAAAYWELLTGYAFARVCRELEEAEWVSFLSAGPERARPACRRRALLTGTGGCQCAFRTAMKLPCRHLLALRRLRGHELYDPTLCSPRWSRQHCQRDQPPPALLLPESEPVPAQPPAAAPPSLGEQTPAVAATAAQQERYSQAYRLSQKLSLLAAGCPAEEFDSCLAVMTTVTNIWARGGQVQVTEINVTRPGEDKPPTPENMPSEVNNTNQN
ncbi:zinc finger SWIM domain-containing protein 1-like isoform X2 [Chiloscyllium plagiosum]|uniref:zinc finger SWIM domain-containing protein 1-like isoform X1 n=2 Tax=Chiloscyllium plagiosum TaxID=36176 RepID=UPI001CB8458F|nr:zinc finger SWIM domain-containing protein 1-like isoform X1 [Chiloscyllium plagiosum]XP_043533845.1 zinc finger SWIM domain-containing protein 1-like isoform X2 [Chiloscyllium plagiosum]